MLALEPFLVVLYIANAMEKVFWKLSVCIMYVIHSLRKILVNIFFLSGDNDEVTISKRHKCYKQVISQIQLSKLNQGYFIVWTTKDSFIKIEGKNEAFWEKVSINFEIFFKKVENLLRQGFVTTRLLAINPLKFCGTCQKVLLGKLEAS